MSGTHSVTHHPLQHHRRYRGYRRVEHPSRRASGIVQTGVSLHHGQTMGRQRLHRRYRWYRRVGPATARATGTYQTGLNQRHGEPQEDIHLGPLGAQHRGNKTAVALRKLGPQGRRMSRPKRSQECVCVRLVPRDHHLPHPIRERGRTTHRELFPM